MKKLLAKLCPKCWAVYPPRYGRCPIDRCSLVSVWGPTCHEELDHIKFPVDHDSPAKIIISQSPYP